MWHFSRDVRVVRKLPLQSNRKHPIILHYYRTAQIQHFSARHTSNFFFNNLEKRGVGTWPYQQSKKESFFKPEILISLQGNLTFIYFPFSFSLRSEWQAIYQFAYESISSLNTCSIQNILHSTVIPFQTKNNKLKYLFSHCGQFLFLSRSKVVFCGYF